MQRAVLILELINALLGIGTNLFSGERVLGIPVGYLNSVFFALFFLGFLLLYWNEKKMKKEIRDSIVSELKLEFNSVAKKYPEGSLDAVSPGDRALINANAIEMTFTHGHMDLEGLLADRASHVPLNELMSKPCSKCGIPRDRKSDKWSKNG